MLVDARRHRRLEQVGVGHGDEQRRASEHEQRARRRGAARSRPPRARSAAAGSAARPPRARAMRFTPSTKKPTGSSAIEDHLGDVARARCGRERVRREQAERSTAISGGLRVRNARTRLARRRAARRCRTRADAEADDVEHRPADERVQRDRRRRARRWPSTARGQRDAEVAGVDEDDGARSARRCSARAAQHAGADRATPARRRSPSSTYADARPSADAGRDAAGAR